MPFSKWILVAIASALFLSTLTGAAPQDAEDAPAHFRSEPATQDPEWFEKLLAREGEVMKYQRLNSADSKIATVVAADIASGPERDEEGDYFFQLSLGSDVPMECWVYPEGHDMAASHQVFADHAFEAMASSYGEIELKSVQRIDAGVFGDHPYLALDWLYRVKSQQGPLAGQLKQLAAHKGEASAFCQHNEVGYSATFERVFQGLVDRLEVEGPPAEKPYYREVTVVRMGETTTGFVSMSLTLDADGDTKILEKSSFLLPIDQATLTGEDNYKIEFSTPDGKVINEVEIGIENNEINKQLQLHRTDEGSWQVSGTFMSKELESSLEPAELLSSLGHMLHLRRFLAQAKVGDETSLTEWVADADPTTLMEIGVAVTGKTGDTFEAKVDMGPLKMDAVLDSNGSMKLVTFVAGPVRMEMRRVYVEGALPDP